MNIVLIGLYCATSLFMLGGCFYFIAWGVARVIEAKAKLVEARNNHE